MSKEKKTGSLTRQMIGVIVGLVAGTVVLCWFWNVIM